MQEVHFNNIRNTIIEHLDDAETNIKIAVAWFTDKRLLKIIEEKANEGVFIELIIYDDHINKKKFFENLYHLKAKIYLSKKRLMHNKFCVIDNFKVINGSYNWTAKANENDENIQISTDDNLVQQFSDKFDDLIIGLPTIDSSFANSISEMENYYNEFNRFRKKLISKNIKFPFLVRQQYPYFGSLTEDIYQIHTLADQYNIAWILFINNNEEFKCSPNMVAKYYDIKIERPHLLNYKILNIKFDDDFIAVLPLEKNIAELYNKVFYINKNFEIIGEEFEYTRKLDNGYYVFECKNGTDSYLLDTNLKKLLLPNVKKVYEVDLDIGIFCALESNNTKIGLYDFKGDVKVAFIYNHYNLEKTSGRKPHLEFVIFPTYQYERDFKFYTKKNIIKDLKINKENYKNYPYLSRNYYLAFKNHISFSEELIIEPVGYKDLIHEYAIPTYHIDLIKDLNRILNIEIEIKKNKKIVPKKKDDFCFVATMVYEDINHPKVIILRNYRDKVLSKSFLGFLFIKLYYFISPHLIKIFNGRISIKIFKNIIERILLKISN